MPTEQPLRLETLRTPQARGYNIRLSGNVGDPYVFQATSDFKTWISLRTNVLRSVVEILPDPEAGRLSHRFYRIVPPNLPLRSGTIETLGKADARLRAFGNVGQPFVFQSSTNLIDWFDLGTNRFLDIQMWLPVPFSPTVPHEFFRVVPTP